MTLTKQSGIREPTSSAALAAALSSAVALLALSGCESGGSAAPVSARLLEQTRVSAAVQLASDNIAAGKFERARGALAGFSATRDLALEVTRARIDVEEGEYVAALERLDAVATEGQQALAWHALRGVALEGLGRWEDAAAAYARAYELKSDAGGLVAWADALVSADRFDEARALLARERGRYPGDASLCLLAARFAARSNDPQTEATELHAAVMAKPDSHEIRRRLGDALMRAGRNDEALAVWDSLSAAELPDATRVRIDARRAECLLDAGRHADARRAFETVVAANPDDFRARLGLAAACLAGGSPNEALQAANAVLLKRPGEPDAVLIAALCQRQLKNTPAAIALLAQPTFAGVGRPVAGELLAAWRAD